MPVVYFTLCSGMVGEGNVTASSTDARLQLCDVGKVQSYYTTTQTGQCRTPETNDEIEFTEELGSVRDESEP